MNAPAEVIEKLFASMAVRYGDAFIRKWAGLDPQHVKDDWSRVLRDLPLDALRYGHANLPNTKPPTATEFRDLCRTMPRPSTPHIENRPEADVHRLEREFRRFHELTLETKKDPKRWARDLRDKERAGIPLSLPQRAAWRAALRYTDGTQPLNTHFTPPDRAALPPGGLRPFEHMDARGMTQVEICRRLEREA